MKAWKRGDVQPRVMKPPTAVTYIAMHHWLRRNLGLASLQQCADCGKQAEQWAYVGGCSDEKSEMWRGAKKRTYCPHPEHYRPRCVKCHRAYDADTRARGERMGTAKLTEDQVQWVRDNAGVLTQREMADTLGVSQPQISRLVNNLRWTHLS